MESYTVNENHIGSVVGEILRYRKISCYFIILRLTNDQYFMCFLYFKKSVIKNAFS